LLRGLSWWEQRLSKPKARERTRATWLVAEQRFGHQGLSRGLWRWFWCLRCHKLTAATELVAGWRHQGLLRERWGFELLARKREAHNLSVFLQSPTVTMVDEERRRGRREWLECLDIYVYTNRGGYYFIDLIIDKLAWAHSHTILYKQAIKVAWEERQ
jgi:hypothetical protein